MVSSKNTKVRKLNSEKLENVVGGTYSNYISQPFKVGTKSYNFLYHYGSLFINDGNTNKFMQTGRFEAGPADPVTGKSVETIYLNKANALATYPKGVVNFLGNNAKHPDYKIIWT